jgi:hypothetical protein
MEIKTTYLPDTTSAEGYVCSSCGAWVGGGGWHSCWTPQVPQPVIPPPFMNPTPIQNIFIDNAILERIAKALEDIAERLADKESL